MALLIRRGKITEAMSVIAARTMGIADSRIVAELRRLAKEAKDERTRYDADQTLGKLVGGG